MKLSKFTAGVALAALSSVGIVSAGVLPATAADKGAATVTIESVKPNVTAPTATPEPILGPVWTHSTTTTVIEVTEDITAPRFRVTPQDLDGGDKFATNYAHVAFAFEPPLSGEAQVALDVWNGGGFSHRPGVDGKEPDGNGISKFNEYIMQYENSAAWPEVLPAGSKVIVTTNLKRGYAFDEAISYAVYSDPTPASVLTEDDVKRDAFVAGSVQEYIYSDQKAKEVPAEPKPREVADPVNTANLSWSIDPADKIVDPGESLTATLKITSGELDLNTAKPTLTGAENLPADAKVAFGFRNVTYNGTNIDSYLQQIVDRFLEEQYPNGIPATDWAVAYDAFIEYVKSFMSTNTELPKVVAGAEAWVRVETPTQPETDVTLTASLDGSSASGLIAGKQQEMQQPANTVEIDGKYYPQGSIKAPNGVVYAYGEPIGAEIAPPMTGQPATPADGNLAISVEASQANGQRNFALDTDAPQFVQRPGSELQATVILDATTDLYNVTPDFRFDEGLGDATFTVTFENSDPTFANAVAELNKRTGDGATEFKLADFTRVYDEIVNGTNPDKKWPGNDYVPAGTKAIITVTATKAEAYTGTISLGVNGTQGRDGKDPKPVSRTITATLRWENGPIAIEATDAAGTNQAIDKDTELTFSAVQGATAPTSHVKLTASNSTFDVNPSFNYTSIAGSAKISDLKLSAVDGSLAESDYGYAVDRMNNRIGELKDTRPELFTVANWNELWKAITADFSNGNPVDFVPAGTVIEFDVTLPTDTVGTGTIEFQALSGTEAVSAKVTVNLAVTAPAPAPMLSLDKPAFTPADSAAGIVFHGENFAPNEDVQVVLKDQAGAEVWSSTLTADAAGKIEGTLPALAAGDYVLTATQNNNVAAAGVKVLPEEKAPFVTFAKPAYTAEESAAGITFTGENFAPNEDVQVVLKDQAGAEVWSGTVTADAAGKIEGTLPALAAGHYDLTATQNNNVAAAGVEVLPAEEPAPVLDPTATTDKPEYTTDEAAKGVAFQGFDFAEGDVEVWLYAPDGTLSALGTIAADAKGHLTGTIPGDKLAAEGRYMLILAQGDLSARVSFQVYEPIVDPTPTATPTQEPTAEPTQEPTATPTQEPTAEPTPVPTTTPSQTATDKPVPTQKPTQVPGKDDQKPGGLAQTGAEDLALLAGIGFALVAAAGGVLMLARRRNA